MTMIYIEKETMLTEKELQALLLKPEAERTDAEKKQISDFFEQVNKPPSTETKDKNLITIEQAFDHPRFKEILQKQKDAEAKAAALEKAQQDAERKALEEANNFKVLYEKAQAEITGLKPKAEQLDSMEKTLVALLETQVKELPEQFQDIIPDGLNTQQKLDWLGKNKSKFMKPEAFDIGAGKTGSKKVDDKTKELTAEQKVAAQSLGMSEEDYKKFSDPVPAP